MADLPGLLSQGPDPRGRNHIADWLREHGLHTLANRFNDPTSGAGMIADLGGDLYHSAAQALTAPSRAYRGEIAPGDMISEGMNVAGMAAMGGVAAPKPTGVMQRRAFNHDAHVLSYEDSLMLPIELPPSHQQITSPMTVYHGNTSPVDFKTFSRGPWMTDSTDLASAAAWPDRLRTVQARHPELSGEHSGLYDKARVYPLQIEPRNPFVHDMATETESDALRRHGYSDGNDAHAIAAANGHDFYIYKNSPYDFGLKQKNLQIVPLEKNSIRSAITGDLLYSNSSSAAAPGTMMQEAATHADNLKRLAQSPAEFRTETERQIHQAKMLANPGADENTLVQITKNKYGEWAATSPVGNIRASQDLPRTPVKIEESEISDPANHGKGYGIALYKALADEAARFRLPMISDYMVSPQAQHMYDALERRGFSVVRDKTEAGGGYTVRGNNQLKIERPPVIPGGVLYSNSRPSTLPGTMMQEAAKQPDGSPHDDPALISILKKYGLMGMLGGVPAGMGLMQPDAKNTPGMLGYRG